MKIFGTTDVQGLIKANTGSFNKFGIVPAATPVGVAVAGTDSVFSQVGSENRSLLSQGLFDYVVGSKDGGQTIKQAISVPAGTVMGYRVEHVTDTDAYSLMLNIGGSGTVVDNSNQNQWKTRLNVSTDGGDTMTVKKDFLGNEFYGFDMNWPNTSDPVYKNKVVYIVGCKFVNPSATTYNFAKFSTFGASISVRNAGGTPRPAVYVSNDAGVTFTEIALQGSLIASNFSSIGDVLTAIAIDPNDETKILYGTENGKIHRSTNAGVNTTLVVSTNSVPINRIVYATGNSNIVYAVCGNNFGQVFKSTDAGINWTQVPIVVNGSTVNYRGGIYDVLAPDANTVIIVGDDYKNIYKSTNGGSSWSAVKTPIIPYDLPLISMKTAPAGTFNAVISEDRCFYRSDGILYPSPIQNQFVEFTGLAINNTSSTNRYICFDIIQTFVETYAFVIKQTAATQYELIVAVPTNNSIIVTDVLPLTNEPTDIFMVSETLGFITTKGGKIIKVTIDIQLKTIAFLQETSGTSEDLLSLYGPKNNSHYNGNYIFAVGNNDTILQRDISVATWTPLTDPTGGSENIVQVAPLSDTNIYVLTNDLTNNTSTVYVTTNGGSSWSTASGGPVSGIFKKFVVRQFGTPVLIAMLSSDGATVNYTIDGGITYLTEKYTFGNIDIVLDNRLNNYNSNTSPIYFFLAGSGGVIHIKDFEDFNKVGPWPATPIALCGITGESGYAYWVGGGTATNPDVNASRTYLLKSTDSGDTWTNVTSTIQKSINFLGQFIITSLSEGKFRPVSSNDMFFIYNSNDSGTSFDPVNSNLYTDTKKYQNTVLGQYNGIRRMHFPSDTVGYAVSNIYDSFIPEYRSKTDTNQNKIAKTVDGGRNWGFLNAPPGYEFRSVFFVSNTTGYVCGYPSKFNLSDRSSTDGKIFKTTDGGQTWSPVHSFTLSSGGHYTPVDIQLIRTDDADDGKYGLAVIQGMISTLNHGIYKTTNSGANWTLVSIANFSGTNTGSQKISFVTKDIGFIGGATYASGPAIYKTTNFTTGNTWSAVNMPAGLVSGDDVQSIYFFDQNTGVFSSNGVIYRTTNSGTAWTSVHTVQSPSGRTADFIYVNEIKFSKDTSVGFAVGIKIGDDWSEHFILKSTNSGQTWTEIDTNHTEVDLEYYGNSKDQQFSALHTIEFLEERKLGGGGPPPPPPPPPTPPPSDCINILFISGSYYNFGNFAYQCNKFDRNGRAIPPVFVPNSSQNVGLGKNIFGQLTNTNKTLLKLKLTYGAALGVNTLGTAEESNRDTAVGYAAMDLLKKAKENVAVGYKALSLNQFDGAGTYITNRPTITRVAVSKDGIYKSNNKCSSCSWTKIQATSSAFTPLDSTSSFEYSQIISPSKTKSYILANNNDGSGSLSNTYIFSIDNTSDVVNSVYTSSNYTISKLGYLNESILYGLDKVNGYMLRSQNGGRTWETGSIQAFSGNVLNDFTVASINEGFLVGTYIWKINTGSNLNWITSSYTGSYEINAIESVASKTWVAVGDSGSIFKTNNAGDSWRIVTQSLTTNDLLDIKFVSNGILVAAGISGSIIYSRTLGDTWLTGSYATTESFNSYHYTSIDSLTSGEIILNSELGSVKASADNFIWRASAADTINSEPIVSLAVSDYKLDTNPVPSIGVSAADLDLSEYRDFNADVDVKDITIENVAIGAHSITAHKNAWGMVGIGARTFQNTSAQYYKEVNPNANKTILGNYYDFVDEKITVPYRPSNYGQVAIGRLSQANSNRTSFNTSVGYGSLYLNEGSNNNTAIGFYSQHLSNNEKNTSLGIWALGINGPVGTVDTSGINNVLHSASYSGGVDNIAIGYKAMLYNISSNRATQILQARNSVGFYDANYFFLHGSRNVVIGNEALQYVSGSSDVVAIGSSAAILGSDLTDSVFIGSFVASNFKTPTGSFYTASDNNNWKPTQTVAVGSYAIQNHIGTDIVAVGANALRGVKRVGQNGSGTNGNPNPTKSTEILLTGIPEGLIFSNPSIFETEIWQTSQYPINKSNQNNLLDLNPGGALLQDNGCSFEFRDLKILSKSTAYALFLTRQERDPDWPKYPILLKTTKLDKASDAVLWDTVQHTDSNGKYTRGVIGDLGPADTAEFSVVDDYNIYILNKGTKYGVYKSVNGGISFTTVLNGSTEFGNKTKLQDIHFTSEQNGSVVGSSREEYSGPARSADYPFHAVTTDGGDNWTYSLIDGANSGRGVVLYATWFNSSHSVGYAVGSYGSVYKTTDSGSTWTKQLGKSASSNYVNSTYNSIPNLLSSTNIVVRDVFFINDSTGWIIISTFGTASDISYVLRTTNGGSTWSISQKLRNRCTGMDAYGAPIPFKVKAVYDPRISQYLVYVVTSYGSLFKSQDGGQTFTTTYNLPKTIDPDLWNRTTDCVPYNASAFDVYWDIDETQQNTERSGNTTSVSQSVAVGADIQVKQDFVENNVAVGYKVQYNASGSAIDSVQIGAKATIEANYVADTVAVGKDSLAVTKYSDKTTAVGKRTLNNLLQDPTNPPYPVLVVNGNYRKVGGEPEVAYSDSTLNTVVGFQAGTSLRMGDKNVFVGSNSGISGNPFIPTYGNNNIIIAANGSKTGPNVINEIGIGNYQNTAAWVWGQFQNQVNPWGVMSDGRDKTDTGSFEVGLSFIRQLQPKQFKWDTRFNYPSGSTPDGTHKQSGSSYGYIAQDVEAAASAVGISGSLFVTNASGSYSGSTDPSGSGNFPLKMFMPGMIDLIAINAIKELDTLVSYLSSSKYTTNIGDSTNSTFSVTHSLATRDVVAMIYSNLTEQVVYPTMSIDTINHIQVTFPTPPGTNEYRIVVMR
jgi:photosystem II stability/assembly factor-like uncharacterized protein